MEVQGLRRAGIDGISQWPWLSSGDCAHLLQANSRPGHPGQRDEALLMSWLLRKE